MGEQKFGIQSCDALECCKGVAHCPSKTFKKSNNGKVGWKKRNAEGAYAAQRSITMEGIQRTYGNSNSASAQNGDGDSQLSVCASPKP